MSWRTETVRSVAVRTPYFSQNLAAAPALFFFRVAAATRRRR